VLSFLLQVLPVKEGKGGKKKKLKRTTSNRILPDSDQRGKKSRIAHRERKEKGKLECRW